MSNIIIQKPYRTNELSSIRYESPFLQKGLEKDVEARDYGNTGRPVCLPC